MHAARAKFTSVQQEQNAGNDEYNEDWSRQSEAATTLQSYHRMRAAQAEFTSVQQPQSAGNEEYDEDWSRQNVAATTLQSYHRMRAVQMEAGERRSQQRYSRAATKLQT